MDATVTVGAQGRLVVPAENRDERALQAGDSVQIQVSGHALVLPRHADAVDELRRVGRAIDSARSLGQELLDDRRENAVG